LTRIAVRDPKSGLGTHLVVPTTGDAPACTSERGTASAFLLERYIAYTHHRGKGRWFEVQHAPWEAAPFQLARFDTALFENEYPWLRRATCVGGHLAKGFADVAMSVPQRVETAALAPAVITAGAGVAAPQGVVAPAS
jgi:hypothetical protein